MRASLVSVSGIDLDVLASLLADVDVHDLWVIKNVVGDGVIFEPIPDIVVGVLNAKNVSDPASPQEGFNNFDVLLRVGQAVARGIPSLLIVPPPLKPPSWIKGLSVALCSPGNRGALADHIWALTVSATRDGASKVLLDRFNPINAELYLSRLKAVEEAYINPLPLSPGAPSGRIGRAYAQFESLISELLVSAGAALAEPPEDAHRYDYADFAFVPSSGSSVVVLAECKLVSGKSKRRISEDEAALYQKVTATHSQLGLLVYHSIDGVQPAPARHPTALVERISAMELIVRLKEKPLQRVIADAVAQAAAR
ncbi:hypothetical protein ACFV0C_05445 [Streptomyces sp. NPDC059568]|uniref:hypothetical protein n=1 Tax=Streptomyces sp. NPDC059568 TaxID=3346868 RepID=UPI00368EB443